MPFQVTIEKPEDIAGLSVPDVKKALQERSEVLHKVFEEAGDELDPSKVTSIAVKDGHDLARQIEARNAEMSSLGGRMIDINIIEGAKTQADRWQEFLNSPAGAGANFAPTGSKDGDRKLVEKDWTELFTDSSLYAAAKSRQRVQASIELEGKAFEFLGRKAIFSTTAGWAPESLRTGRVVLDEQREIEVTDIFPLIPTTQAAIVYMEETTFTNNAAERAEGGAYVESALALTERSETVRSIGTSLPVTDEQLADVDGVRAYLNQRLGFMVRQRLDSQLMVGDGNAPNLRGTLNVVGIGTQALGGDPRPDAVYKAMDVVRVTGRAIPNVLIIHPNDWQPIRLLKTVDGIYIWGSPSEVGPAMIWGMPVVQTTAITENTALVGDYARFASFNLRAGLEVLTGFVNDDFTDGRVTIRAGLRGAAVHYRPSAFCQITGL